MWDIYYNEDYVCGGYETEERAYKTLEEIIERNHLKFRAGGSDGPNSWGVYLFVDEMGWPNYDIISIKKNDYKTHLTNK